MADTVDSISIELTASTESAESSIDRLIGKLNQLKGAVSGASNFNRVVQGIARIAAVASGIDGDAGRKLNHLAAGLTALSKVGNLDNLKGAGKNLASVMKAVSGETGGKGLSGLADGIKQTNDALGGIKDSDVSRLGAIRDTLAGEVSGPLHTSEIKVESPVMGGVGATVFDNYAMAIRTADAANRDFMSSLGSGTPTYFTDFANTMRDATAAYREFQAALGGGVPPIFTDFADSAAQAGESVRMLTGSVGGGQEGPWEADEIRDAARAYDELGGSASRAADVIETEFADTEKAASGLTGLRDTLGSIGGYIANDITNVFSNTLKAIGGFGRSVLRIARYRLIRSMIRTITEGFSEGKKNLYEWSQAMDGHFAASMDRLATSTQYLKNSLGTLVGPLMEALEPALNHIIDVLVTIINYFNMFVAAISGRSTYTAAVRAATTWGGAVSNAAGNASNAVSNAVDDMKRTIMGFDEINKLNDVTDSAGGSGSGGSGGGSGGGVGGMFEERPLSGGFQDFGKALETALQDSLSRITLIVGAAELAVGAILALSGANVPLGIALMATGAVTMGSAIFANWDGIPDEIKLVVGAIEAALGGGLAVGAVLAFSTGHIGLGIGLMVAALSTEFSAVTVVWTTLKDKIGGQIKTIEELVGGALIGIGAVLAFAGHPAIGLAMLVAGLTIEAVAIDWGALTGKVGEKINELKGLIVGAEIVFGVIFLLAGNIPLGLALLIAGGIGAGLELVNNWGNITEWFAERWKDFKKAAEDTWDSLKEIGAGIWGKIKEGITGAVEGVGGWIKEHIFQPFINAWHWLLGLFGGGNDSGLSSNASVNVTTNAASVADDIAEGATDKESIQKLKEIGATMGDAIKTGMNERLKNISGEIWNTIVTGWNSEARELPVSVTYGTSGSIDAPASIEIPVSMVKTWKVTALEWLGLDNLSAKVSMAMVKSWKNTALEWLGMDNLSAKVSMAMVKSWKNTALEWLGLDNLSAKVSMAMVKSWKNTALEWLGLDNLSATVSMAMEKSWKVAALAWLGLENLSALILVSLTMTNDAQALWTTFKTAWDNIVEPLKVKVELDYSGTDGFGGATGGGGSTNGGGAGRSIKVAVEPETTVGGKTFWERAKEAIDAAGTAVDKGLDVIVRPALNSAGERITSIVQWLFGNNTTPEVNTKVNGTAGTGFSGVTENKFSLSGINAGSVTVNGTPGAGFAGQLSGTGHKYTLAGIEDANVNVKSELTGMADGSKTLPDVYGDFNTKSILTGANKTAEGAKTLTGIYGDFNTRSILKGKVKNTNSLTNVYGKSFDTRSNLTGKSSESKNLSQVHGNVFKSYSNLTGKSSDSKTLTGVFGSSFEVRAKLSSTIDGLKSFVDKIANAIKDAIKGIRAQSGGVISNGKFSRFASGGIIRNNLARHLDTIPHYAGGTTDAHGTLFLAGEAGPEILGHIGGRTEILNQSQLAATMFSAVRSAMSGVKIAATMYDGGADNGEADYETMYRAMYDAFTDAMAGSNERDREKVALMRQIAAKEFTAEVTAASMNRAQTRMNRRAGTTIVPVGT